MMNKHLEQETLNCTLWSAILESVGDGILVLDMDLKVIYANPTACHILDLSAVKLHNATIDEVMVLKNDAYPNFKSFTDFISQSKQGLPKHTYIHFLSGIKKFISLQISKTNGAIANTEVYVLVLRDISQFYKAESQVEKERDQMIGLFNDLPISMILIDRDLKIRQANKSFRDLMGLFEHDPSGSVVGDAIGCVWSFNGGCGHGLQCLYCKLRKQLKMFIQLNRPFKDFLIEIKHQINGDIKSTWLNISFIPTEFADQSLYMVTLEDQTNRIRHERLLDDARQKSLKILNNLPVMIFRLNSEKQCDFINDRFREKFDIKTSSQFPMMRSKFPEDGYKAFMEVFYANEDQNHSISYEFEIYDADQKPVNMLLVGTPEKEEGSESTGYLCLIFDIHAEKQASYLYRQSQKKYYALYQYMDSGIVYFKLIKDHLNQISDAEIMESNQATYTILGIEDEGIEGKRLSELNSFTEFELHQLMNHFQTVDKTKENIHVGEFYFVNFGKWLELSIYTPEESSIAVLFNDIDSKKKTAMALMSEKERSEEANRVKSEFLANMSHEIRTPLNGIMGMIDLTFMDSLSEEQKSNLNTAKECVVSLLDIINDILDFSKIEAGKLKVTYAPFNLTDLIENTIKIHLPHMDDKGLDFEIFSDRIIENSVIGDSKRIRQIINNLLGNAIKFTDQGKITLSISQKEQSNSNQYLTRFVIEDTGIGIAKEKQKLLFNSFTQIDGTFTKNYGGTGLGLVISKQLVEMMGGNIGFQSDFGVGSVFEFSIPLAYEDLPQPASGEQRFEPKNYAGKHVLLVEDDRVNQIVLEKMLGKEGVTTTVASNGKDALDLCNMHAYNLILMDIQMPLMDGIEATRQIRMNSRKNRLTPIVALTAFALKGDEDIFRASGMDGYISKPIDRTGLIELLDEFMNQPDQTIVDVIESSAESSVLFDKKNSSMGKTQVLTRETLYELKHRIRQLQQNFENEDYLMLEVNAHQLKARFEALKVEELKTLVFKIELDMRKEKYDRIHQLIEQLYTIIDGFYKNEEEMYEKNFNR